MSGGVSSSGDSVETSAAPAPASAANVSSTCHDGVLELHRERDVARPCREEAGQLGVVALHEVRDAVEDGPEPGPERPVRAGEPRDAGGRVGQRPGGSAALGLDGEPERLRGRRQPRGDLVRGRRLVVGVVELDGRQPGRIGWQQVRGAGAGGVEARAPAGVGEAAGPRVEPASHGRVRPRRLDRPRRRQVRTARGRARSRRGRPPRASPGRRPARSASSTTSRKWSAIPRRWVRDAARRRRSPASVRTASAPRASVVHELRSTRPSATSRSISRVTPLLLSTTWSARRRIRSRRPGASAMFRSASYSATDRSCSARSSSSRRRATRACACRKARHGSMRGSCADSGRVAGSVTFMAGMLHPRDG